MPDTEPIFKKLKSMLADQLGIKEDEVTMEATLEDLGADSLDIVELVMAIEQEWDMEIPDEAAEEIRTVSDAVAYIVRHAG